MQNVRKTVIRAGIVLASLAALGACATTGPNPSDRAVGEFEVIEHKGTTLGVATPDWVLNALEGSAAVEAMDEYEGQYVIIVDQRGESLQGVQTWADNFEAQAEIAQRITTRVEQRFAGAAAGDIDRIETYLEEVVRTVSEAQFSGFASPADWWVHYRWYEEDGRTVDREEYRYIVLYTIERRLLDEQIRTAIENAPVDEPQNDEERTARERVKDALYEEGL
jgi:hypothetical protein